MAENERVKLLNPPDETPELFEKYLPFAVLFKVEEVWGERFKDLLSKDPQQPGYSAGWYSGSNFSQFTNSVASSGFRSAMDKLFRKKQQLQLRKWRRRIFGRRRRRRWWRWLVIKSIYH
jgi:hypothetical protein